MVRTKTASTNWNLFTVSLVLVCTLGLVACSSEEGDDLDQFIKNAANDMHARIEPLPEVKPYIPLQYNADGMLQDPFEARKAKAKGAGSLQPDVNRPKEALEAYPLESMKFVGLLEKKKLSYGLIEIPDKTVQQIKLGNYIGQNYGRVVAIRENGIDIKEIVQDDATGDWVERQTSLDLKE